MFRPAGARQDQHVTKASKVTDKIMIYSYILIVIKNISQYDIKHADVFLGFFGVDLSQTTSCSSDGSI